MKLIIPVAGAGTRLKPHTISNPKALLQVAGKPMLDHILQPLAVLQPEECLLVVGYLGNKIVDHVSENYNIPMRFIAQEKLLGLGFALHLALQEIESGPVLIVLGDTIVDCDVSSMVQAGEYVLGVRKVDDPTRFGIAEVSNGSIVRLEEKPQKPRSDLALIGLYYFQEIDLLKNQLNELVRSGKTTAGEIQFTDALQGMIESGTAFVPFEVNDWYDCGKKETLLATNRHLLAKLPEPFLINGSTIIPHVSIADTASIVNCTIGPNVAIGNNSCLENCTIDNSIIGDGTSLKNVVCRDSLVGHQVVVEGTRHNLNLGDYSEVRIVE